jgi:ADP-ribosylglycohydrolase
MNRDRIEGMFLGTLIGDALGMPVETFTAEKIASTYGRVTEYLTPDGHKWFNGHKAGTYTDDTQLTLAVAEALIDGGFDMECQARHHVSALRETTAGWGNTTRNAIRSLANGATWQNSGTGGNGSGTGNGVAMKIAPLGALLAKCPIIDQSDDTGAIYSVTDFILQLNAMTHKTSLSASAALAQAAAVAYCISRPAFYAFHPESFMQAVTTNSSIGRNCFPETLTDDLTERLEFLDRRWPLSQKEAIEEFGGGSCYCYHSIPFTLSFFINQPYSISSLYDLIGAGGDTDSNASMLGALLGALHGKSIFPDHLIQGALDHAKVLDVAGRFAEKFGFV